jgi:xanthine/CO dehydrogenase XdhC/CoxF family maturation factor
MNHNGERDRESLQVLLGTKLRYIGVIGPRSRTQRLLRELEQDDEDPRVVGPAGLQIGAESPQELALAIISEIQAVLSGTPMADIRQRIASPMAERTSGSGSFASIAVAGPLK